MKPDISVRPIDKKTADAVVKAKHYKGKLGIFWYGFGAFRGDTIVGVCVFGQPSTTGTKKRI